MSRCACRRSRRCWCTAMRSDANSRSAFLDVHDAGSGDAGAEIDDENAIGTGCGNVKFHAAIAVLVRQTVVPHKRLLVAAGHATTAAEDAQIHVGVLELKIVGAGDDDALALR